MNIENINDLLEHINDTIYHHYYRELGGNLPLIERCIRHFEAATTSLKFTRDQIIREQSTHPIKDSYNEKFCDFKTVCIILDRTKGTVEKYIKEGRIKPIPDKLGRKRRFIRADINKFAEGGIFPEDLI